MRLSQPVARKYFKENRIFLTSKTDCMKTLKWLLRANLFVQYLWWSVAWDDMGNTLTNMLGIRDIVASDIMMKFIFHKLYRDLSLLKLN